MTIDTLLFDLGDVLIDIDWSRGGRTMLGQMKDENGGDLTVEEITARIHPGPHGSVWDDFGLGEKTLEQFLDLVVLRTQYDGRIDALQRAMTELFEPLPERIRLLNAFALNPDYKVAIVSDTNIMHSAYIEDYIPQIFENIPHERRFYSYSAGKMKKFGGDFYSHVLNALGTKPENALMIDDQPKNQIGADAIGLHFLLVQKDEDLQERLKNWL